MPGQFRFRVVPVDTNFHIKLAVITESLVECVRQAYTPWQNVMNAPRLVTNSYKHC